MYLESNINHRIIREFWNNFTNTTFNHIDFIDKVADRNSYTDEELYEIDFSLTLSNIEFPCKEKHLPHGFYYEILDRKYKLLKEFEELEAEIFTTGKYDSLLIEINKYAFEQRMYSRQFTSTEAFIKLREFENFGEIYQFSLKKFQKEIGKDYTEIDFLNDDIAFCKKELETQESIDIINLFKRRIRVFEKRITELNQITNDKLINPITETTKIELLTKLMIVSYFNDEVKIQLFTSGNENYKEQANLDLIDIRECIKENKILKNTWRTNDIRDRIYEASVIELKKLFENKFKEATENKNFKTTTAFASYELNDFKSRYENYFGFFPIAKQWCEYLESEIKKISNLPTKKLNQPQLKVKQIALIYAYNGTQITRENAGEIAKAYDYNNKNSGEGLFQDYTFYSNPTNRKATPTLCTPKKLKNKIELLESVTEYISDNAKQRLIDEVKILKTVFENEYQ